MPYRRAAIGPSNSIRAYSQTLIVLRQALPREAETCTTRNEHNVSLVRENLLRSSECEALRRLGPRRGHEARKDAVCVDGGEVGVKGTRIEGTYDVAPVARESIEPIDGSTYCVEQYVEGQGTSVQKRGIV